MSGGKPVSDMDAVRTAEFKEAFDEFDKVYILSCRAPTFN